MLSTTEVTPMLDQLLRAKDAAVPTPGARLTIRTSGPGDAAAIRRLAQLDSSSVPAEPVLLAEVGGEPWAAVSLADGSAVADPFRPTAELVLVMIDRARELRRAERRPPRRGLLRRVPAFSA
jgi:hypothetical protein